MHGGMSMLLAYFILDLMCFGIFTAFFASLLLFTKYVAQPLFDYLFRV